MTPEEYYRQNILLCQTQLKHIQKQRNIITLLKLSVSGGLVYALVLIISEYTLTICLTFVAAIGLFILLTVADNRIVRKIERFRELIRINRMETEYLQGKLTHFPTGEAYTDPSHPYSSDLDLFGENSLFQHLCRTVTFGGTHTLTTWILNLAKDPAIIQQRQQATANLLQLPDWCQRFRAEGRFHPTHELDTRLLQEWYDHPSFFGNSPKARILLYIANGIVISSWLSAMAGILPYALPLCLSLVQLIILSLLLKKINRYHQKLSDFLKTLSNYHPFVELIHNQQFSATYLKNIRQNISHKSCNALQALSRLNKIQDSLDQRGNILLAFVLNGLYLKDLHLILRLDKWKKEYGPYINTWIESVSEMDALISMATYRFNHPEYSVPVPSKDSLLEMHEAGHPLLNGQQNVTNNFKADSLHQLFIVTGANMAGKSTFLRTVGINLVLAQSGNVTYSQLFKFQPMAVFTSMRTTDNLAKHVSYFHAELLRLKQLITLAQQEEHLFIILDEMLKGTNSVDKLHGSQAFLKKLLNYPVTGLVATHDLVLGELAGELPDHFTNICFEITHRGENIIYDYKLRPGVSNTMNATILLKQMGLI